MTWLCAISAAVAGGAQTCLIAQAATRGQHFASMWLRVLLACAVLFLCARLGHLISGVVGWTLGLTLTGAALYRRLP